MKKLTLLVTTVLALAISVATASAAQIKLIRGGDTSGYTKVVPLDSDLAWINNSYVAGLTSKFDSKSGKFGFGAFCLEASVHFANGGIYNALITDRALNGGGISGDPISVGTAWLVKMFAVGALDSYGFTYGNKASTLAVQRAIWFLEGESGGESNSWITLLIGKFGSLAGAKADYTGSQVKVLALWDNERRPAQSQAIYVPDVASTLALAGLALVALAIGSRRKTA
ncbi:hypothetical protein [Nibricoccus sp. IMCC34717]|uniref:hypothetical protein n=1 Tax=Nibricoccus sp. IMCC34717 TaxID=3034021 RepID=UPI00384E4D87